MNRPLRSLVMVLILPILLAGCLGQNSPTIPVPSSTDPLTDASSSPEPTATGDTLATVDAASLTTALTNEFRSAEDLARSWSSDSQLYAVTVSFPSSLAVGRSKRVYVFGSSAAPADWWTVTINEITEQRVRALIPREDYLEPTLAPVPQQYWQLNAIEALQRAEQAGGADFRATNPNVEATATLTRQGPLGWLWWVVSYRSEQDDVLTIRIHPVSGEIYDEQGEVITQATEDEETIPVTDDVVN